MAFTPSDAFIIMGHGTEPKVTLEDEQNFIPCPCKIKSKDPTIGSKINDGLVDVDLFFIVPNNCIIVVKATPGEKTHSTAIFPLLNKIGSAENQELFRNPLLNTKALIKELGPVSIFKPGDKCPNFEYKLFFNRDDIDTERNKTISHLGVIKTPIKTPIALVDYDADETIIDTIDNTYSESIFPSIKTVTNTILSNMLEDKPSGKETETVNDLLSLDNPNGYGILDYVKDMMATTQKQMLRIGADGIAQRPGVYYNFICRRINTDYYSRLASGYKNKVNPAITSILQESNKTQEVFKRVLNETVRKRKPYVQSVYYNGAYNSSTRKKRAASAVIKRTGSKARLSRKAQTI